MGEEPSEARAASEQPWILAGFVLSVQRAGSVRSGARGVVRAGGGTAGRPRGPGGSQLETQLGNLTNATD